MAVQCGIHSVNWILPPTFHQDFTFNAVNQQFFHTWETMGSFESKFADENNNKKVIVEKIPLQNMPEFKNIELLMNEQSHTTSTSNGKVTETEQLQETWPSCDEQIQDCDNVSKIKEINGNEIEHNISARSSTNKRSRSDDCVNINRDFPLKKFKKPSFIVKGREMQAFFNLLGDPFVSDFLSADGCRHISDKYLLAMVFAYFKRADFALREFNRMNFFTALYLANDMEEDEEDFKYEIFPWALGKKWKSKYMGFLQKRDKLWVKMSHRAIVSKKCCEEIMAIEPGHSCWQRDRPEHHAGAHRVYARDEDDDAYPRGPDMTPRMCKQCDSLIEYDSANASSGMSWYLSSSDSSPERETTTKCIRLVPSRFDMEDLRITLKGADNIWASDE